MENIASDIRLRVRKGLSILLPSIFPYTDGSAKTRKIVINGGKENRHFKNNKVVNSKYSPWTFLFVMAWHQFSTAMSMYFLLIASLQLFSVITPVHPITSWAPIGVVFTISCVREGIDDIRRRRRDKTANMKPYTVWKCGREIQECPAMDIRVGDLVLLDDGDEAPCDLFLLRTAGVVPGGIAYVETANLDGEIDLKVRTARPELQEIGVPVLANSYGILECENPNADLYRFESKLGVAGAMGPFGLAIDEYERDDLRDSPRRRRRRFSARLGTSITSDLSSSSSLLKQSNHGKARYKVDSNPMSPQMSQESEGLLGNTSNSRVDTSNVFSTPRKSIVDGSQPSLNEADDKMVHFQTGPDQFIQAGVVLRRTGWVLGVAVYTGSETKLAMSRSKGTTKSTRADARINKFVAGVFLVQLVVVITYGILGNKWPGNENPDWWYFRWNKKSIDDLTHFGDRSTTGLDGYMDGTMEDTTYAPFHYPYDPALNETLASEAPASSLGPNSLLSYVQGVVSALTGKKDASSTPFGWMLLPLRFLLLSSIVVPISLRVSLDIAKTWAAQQITRDPNISTVSKEPVVDLKKTRFPWFRNIYGNTGVWAGAASTSIAEDLGVITHILTDKTGTLTENIMVLAAVSVDGNVFGTPKVSDALMKKKRVSIVLPNNYSGRTGRTNPTSTPAAPSTLSRDISSPSTKLDTTKDATSFDATTPPTALEDVTIGVPTSDEGDTKSILRNAKLRGPSFDIAPSTSTATSQPSLVIQGPRSQRFESSHSYQGMLTPVPDRANVLELPTIGKSDFSLDDEAESPVQKSLFTGPGTVQRDSSSNSDPNVETDLDGTPIPPMGLALREALRNKNPRVMAFLRGLVLCNTVSPEHMDATPVMTVQQRRASLSMRSSPPVVDENTNTRISPLRLQVPRERMRCLQFASSSPDEEALVHGAATAGVILANRRTSGDGVQRITISYNTSVHGGGNPVPTDPAEAEPEYAIPQYVRNAVKRATKEEEKPDLIKTIWVNDYFPESTYEILSIIEFTPDRRRMSVLVRCSHAEEGTPEDESRESGKPDSEDIFNAPMGTIFLVTKGADDVIIPRTTVGVENQAHGDARNASGAPDTTNLVSTQSGQGVTRDSALFPLTLSHLEGFSEEGLRTLLVAARVVPQDEYDAWKPRFDDAMRIIGADKREAEITKLAEEMERDLKLLGVTAIEDRLGPDVPYSINTLQQAGIKVWMLTGDKASTALQIGRSAGFFGDAGTDKESSVDEFIPPEFGDSAQSLDVDAIHHQSSFNNTEIDIVSLMKPRTSNAQHRQSLALPPIHVPTATNQDSSQIVYHISGRSSAAVLAEINVAWEELVPPLVCGIGSEVLGSIMDSSVASQRRRSMVGPPRSTVLLIQGHILPYALANKAAMEKLLQAATAATAVIACRCTPAQKASLVRALKESGATVLAIGDGGNDVAMIQEAHVGVGISGREGQQAARAGDYSIAQFSFLVNLLLLHGRYAHWRTSIVACFTFARCAAVAALQLLANNACGFSGCSLLDAMSLTTYNVLYTSLPGLLLCLDVDRHPDEVIKNPHLYFESAGNPDHPNAYLSMRRMFFWWGVRSVWQAASVYFICIFGMGIAGGHDPTSGDFHSLSAVAFMSLVITQLVTAIFESFSPTALQYLLHFGTLLLCLLLTIIRSVLIADDTAFGVGLRLFSSPLSMSTMIISTIVALLPWTIMTTWTEGRWKDGKGIKDRNIRVQPTHSTVQSLSRFISHKLDKDRSFLSSLPMMISQFLSFRSNSRRRSKRPLFGSARSSFGRDDQGKKGEGDGTHYSSLPSGGPGTVDHSSSLMRNGHDGGKYSGLSDVPSSTSITIDGRHAAQEAPKSQMLRRGNASSTTPINAPDGDFTMSMDYDKSRALPRSISNSRKPHTPNKPRSKSPSPSNSAASSLVAPLVDGIKSLWQPGKVDDK